MIFVAAQIRKSFENTNLRNFVAKFPRKYGPRPLKKVANKVILNKLTSCEYWSNILYNNANKYLLLLSMQPRFLYLLMQHSIMFNVILEVEGTK